MDGINLFDTIPEDLLIRIINYYKYSEISTVSNISTSFRELTDKNLLINIVRLRIHKEFRFTLSLLRQYDMTQLIRIGTTFKNCKTISAGYFHSFVLNTRDQVYAFGSNKRGQLGLGKLNTQQCDNRNTPTLITSLINIIDISGGDYHSLALTADGHVYAFGDNSYGQLGLGELNIQESDINIPTLIHSLTNVVAISVRKFHSLVLTGDGHVYAFGDNSHGQLGSYDYDSMNIPTLIPSLNNIISVSAGAKHSLILNANGRVYAFGSNAYGQLGLGDNNHRNCPTLISSLTNIIAISTGDYHSLALTGDGQVYSFGCNGVGPLGLGDHHGRNNPTLIPGLTNIIAISTGGFYSLLLTDDGHVYAFGCNQRGQLGLDDDFYRISPTLIPSLTNVISIATGGYHSLALTSDGHIYSFGYNRYGQLGLNDNNDRNTPTLAYKK